MAAEPATGQADERLVLILVAPVLAGRWGSPCATKAAWLPAVRHSIERRSTEPLALFARAGGESMMMAGPPAAQSVQSLATSMQAPGSHHEGNKAGSYC